MELRFTETEEALRGDVRSFLLDNIPAMDGPAGPGGSGEASEDDFLRAKEFNGKLADRGWIAPAWPTEYGGLGASITEQMVFNEEFGYHGAPDTGTRGFGVGMIGPTLIIHGNDEQKSNYLPKITSGEHIWCQGYSEPGSGSDLASLQTRAVRDGDDYIINGQKIWTSGGHRANQMFCLVRTDPDAPKHRGISFLLIDDIKSTPGLSVRPLINMASRHHFNEVFFEDVRVPARNLIGEENRGWYVGMTLLDFERSGISTTAGQRRTLEQLSGYLQNGGSDKREDYRLGPRRPGDLQQRRQVPRLPDRPHPVDGPGAQLRGLGGQDLPVRAGPEDLQLRDQDARSERSADSRGAHGPVGRGHARAVPALCPEHDLLRHQRDSAQHHRDAGAGSAAGVDGVWRECVMASEPIAHTAQDQVDAPTTSGDGEQYDAHLAAFDEARRTDPETAYFWTEEWQEGEREADDDIRAGRLSPVFTREEAMKYLREL